MSRKDGEGSEQRGLIDSAVASLSEGQARTIPWLLAEALQYCSAPRNKCPFCAFFFSLSLPRKLLQWNQV